MISTKNFNPEVDKKLLCTCGHEECDQRSISQLALNMLQMVRDDLGFPLAVTSGGRCPNHPEQARKRNPNGGDHPKGLGVDIKCNGATRGNIVMAGRKVGFNAIGVAKTFVHLGYRAELPEGHVTMWSY